MKLQTSVKNAVPPAPVLTMVSFVMAVKLAAMAVVSPTERRVQVQHLHAMKLPTAVKRAVPTILVLTMVSFVMAPRLAATAPA